jgi:hypothetical protein
MIDNQILIFYIFIIFFGIIMILLRVIGILLKEWFSYFKWSILGFLAIFIGIREEAFFC